MSNRIMENSIEEFTIKKLERLGSEYIYAPTITTEQPPRLTNSPPEEGNL